MEYWSSGVLKKTENDTGKEATTKTRRDESTKEEGGYLNLLYFFVPSKFRAFVIGFLLGSL